MMFDVCETNRFHGFASPLTKPTESASLAIWVQRAHTLPPPTPTPTKQIASGAKHTCAPPVVQVALTPKSCPIMNRDRECLIPRSRWYKNCSGAYTTYQYPPVISLGRSIAEPLPTHPPPPPIPQRVGKFRSEFSFSAKYSTPLGGYSSSASALLVGKAFRINHLPLRSKRWKTKPAQPDTNRLAPNTLVRHRS